MRMGRAILIVDNDPALRAILAEQLSLGDEFAVTEAGCIAVAHQMFRDLGAEAVHALCRPSHVVHDIKGIFSRDGSDLRL